MACMTNSCHSIASTSTITKPRSIPAICTYTHRLSWPTSSSHNPSRSMRHITRATTESSVTKSSKSPRDNSVSASQSQYAAPEQAVQQLPQSGKKVVEVPYHHVDPETYDLNYFHYKVPMMRFFSPPMVIGTGLGLIAAANYLEGASLKTTIVAAVPVLAWWFLLLHVVPKQFSQFALNFMETHDFVNEDGTNANANDAAQQQQQQRQQN